MTMLNSSMHPSSHQAGTLCVPNQTKLCVLYVTGVACSFCNSKCGTQETHGQTNENRH